MFFSLKCEGDRDLDWLCGDLKGLKLQMSARAAQIEVAKSGCSSTFGVTKARMVGLLGLNHSLGIQICKQYQHWAPKFVNVTYIGLFGSQGIVSRLRRLSVSSGFVLRFGLPGA